MSKYCLSILLLFPLAIFAQDPGGKSGNLFERVAGIKNVGLQPDEKIGGFIVIVYDDKENAENRAILKRHSEEWENGYERSQKYQKLLNEALDKGNYVAADLYMRMRDEKEPDPLFGVVLYEVIRVSSDYIELKALYRAKGTEVIPMSKIVRIKFPDLTKG